MRLVIMSFYEFEFLYGGDFDYSFIFFLGETDACLMNYFSLPSVRIRVLELLWLCDFEGPATNFLSTYKHAKFVIKVFGLFILIALFFSLDLALDAVLRCI